MSEILYQKRQECFNRKKIELATQEEEKFEKVNLAREEMLCISPQKSSIVTLVTEM